MPSLAPGHSQQQQQQRTFFSPTEQHGGYSTSATPGLTNGNHWNSSTSSPTTLLLQQPSQGSPSPWSRNYPAPPSSEISKCHPQPITTKPTSAALSPQERKSLSMLQRPCLINLSSNSEFLQYYIPPGVTMLGTGKGCIKAPDILLENHSSSSSHSSTITANGAVAPQHAFIERQRTIDEDEVILHPISELTYVNSVQVYGPTPLKSGYIIGIGDSHCFQFEGSQSISNNNALATFSDELENHYSRPTNQQHSQHYQQQLQGQVRRGYVNNFSTSASQESPYATINNSGNHTGIRSSSNNPSVFGYSAGDYSSSKNNNSFQDQRLQQYQIDHHREFNNSAATSRMENHQRDHRKDLTLTDDSCSSNNLVDGRDFSQRTPSNFNTNNNFVASHNNGDDGANGNGDVLKKYRDGLESEKFMNKLAKFESLTTSQPAGNQLPISPTSRLQPSLQPPSNGNSTSAMDRNQFQRSYSESSYHNRGTNAAASASPPTTKNTMNKSLNESDYASTRSKLRPPNPSYSRFINKEFKEPEYYSPSELFAQNFENNNIAYKVYDYQERQQPTTTMTSTTSTNKVPLGWWRTRAYSVDSANSKTKNEPLKTPSVSASGSAILTSFTPNNSEQLMFHQPTQRRSSGNDESSSSLILTSLGNNNNNHNSSPSPDSMYSSHSCNSNTSFNSTCYNNNNNNNSPQSNSSSLINAKTKANNNNSYYGSGSGGGESMNGSSSKKFPTFSFNENDEQEVDEDSTDSCISLVDLKRKQKQMQDPKYAIPELGPAEKLDLDQILAVCEEYEEQIAKEIEEKRNSSSSSNSAAPAAAYQPGQSSVMMRTTGNNSLSNYSQHTSPAAASQTFNISTSPFSSCSSASPMMPSNIKTSPKESQSSLKFKSQNNSLEEKVLDLSKVSTSSSSSSGGGSSSLASPSSLSYPYSRIKTNGSLPRESKKSSTTIPSPANGAGNGFNNNDNNSANSSSQLFSFSNSSNKTYESDDVFLSPISTPTIKTTFFTPPSKYSTNTADSSPASASSSDRISHSQKSPYENVYLIEKQAALNARGNGESSSSSLEKSQMSLSPRNSTKTNGNIVMRDSVTNNGNNIFNFSNNAKPIISTSSPKEPTTPTKGKNEKCSSSPKSVSFSNAVVEFHSDDDEGPNANKISPNSTDKSSIHNESTNNNGARSIVKTGATSVQVHVDGTSIDNNAKNHIGSDKTDDTNFGVNPARSCGPVQVYNIVGAMSKECGIPQPSSSSIHNGSITHVEESRPSVLKKEIKELEQQLMEAFTEFEIEKALLQSEETSKESELKTLEEHLSETKLNLNKFNETLKQWKEKTHGRLYDLTIKLKESEKELQHLEKMHENFCGTTDDETTLLESLKFQHELVESDRKIFEDAEFHQMEEGVNKESKRDELSKTFLEANQQILIQQFKLEQLQIENRISLGESAKEIFALDGRRKELIKELQRYQESEKLTDTLKIPESSDGGASDTETGSEDGRNCDLDEKLKNLSIYFSASDDKIRIERIKSRSPIDPQLGAVGTKTKATLKEIERHRDHTLNEQGVQILEEERQRVRELQKSVQDAVRAEWEASRKSRDNQCHSLNSVGSEDSAQTISDTPTDSGCSEDTATDKSVSQSITTTDGSLNENNNGDGNSSSIVGASDTTTTGQNSFEPSLQHQQQQMRQKKQVAGVANNNNTRGLGEQQLSSQLLLPYEESTRPLSESSAFDNSIVMMRDKHRVQNRPLTRYLPVRGDTEESFDLRHHIESSGHQLELCSQVIVTSTAARGFLQKLGARFHNWNRRWFVFDRETRTLSHYADRNEKKPRGGIHFQAIENVYVDHSQSLKTPNEKLTFCVKTYNRIFYFVAPSAEAMRIWIDVIWTGAEGYQEYKTGST